MNTDKKLLILILLVLTTAGFTSRRALLFNRGAGGGGASDACASCTNETFEGAGYAVAGWTESGLERNEDYTTAPAPIIGSDSLLIRNAAFAMAYSSINLPSSGEGWMRFALIATNTVVDVWFVAVILDGTGNEQAAIYFTGGKLEVRAGSSTATTVASITANTTNYVWFHYLKGTGANAVADVAFAMHPAKTRPTGGNNFAQLSNGTTTENALEYWVGGGDRTSSGAFAGVIYDNVSLTTTSGLIGDFP